VAGCVGRPVDKRLPSRTGPLTGSETFKLGPTIVGRRRPGADEWSSQESLNSELRHHAKNWLAVFNDPNSTPDRCGVRATPDAPPRSHTGVAGTGLQQAIAGGTCFSADPAIDYDIRRINLSRHVHNPLRFDHGSPDLAPARDSPFGTFYSLLGRLLEHEFWELDFWGPVPRSSSPQPPPWIHRRKLRQPLVTLLADVATNYLAVPVARLGSRSPAPPLHPQAKLVALSAARESAPRPNSTLNADRTLRDPTRSRPSVLCIRSCRVRRIDILQLAWCYPAAHLDPNSGASGDHAVEFNAGSCAGLIPNWVAVGIPADLLRRRPYVPCRAPGGCPECPERLFGS